MAKTDLKRAVWPIRKLKPHPRQSDTFPDLSEADMKANGLQHPVEIFPDGTILAGLLPIQRLHFWVVVAFLVLHGIATEVGQSYVAGRHGSLRDVLIDWAVVGIGLLFLAVLKSWHRSACAR